MPRARPPTFTLRGRLCGLDPWGRLRLIISDTFDGRHCRSLDTLQNRACHDGRQPFRLLRPNRFGEQSEALVSPPTAEHWVAECRRLDGREVLLEVRAARYDFRRGEDGDGAEVRGVRLAFVSVCEPEGSRGPN